MSARMTEGGEVEIVCDGDACGAIGGRDADDETARTIAWGNDFHSHVTTDDEAHYCPRCAPGCPACEDERAAPRLTICKFCGDEIVEADAHVWAFNLLCDGCFALRFTGRAREVA
jgi:hypothetical protein